MNVKKLVKSVFEGMERTKGLKAHAQRAEFYKSTSEPRFVELSVDMLQDEVYYQLKEYIYYSFNTSSILTEVEVTDFDNETGLAKYDVRCGIRMSALDKPIDDRPAGFKSAEYFTAYTSKRPEKVAKVLQAVYNGIATCPSVITGNVPSLDRSEERNRGDYQDRVKSLQTMLNGSSVWLYFTDNNIHHHYLELARKEHLSSCMSRSTFTYGVRVDGDYIHPLQGYEHAPDFRLALASPYNPDQIKAMLDSSDDDMVYPFTARAIVFTKHESDEHDKPYSYARIYGSERASRAIRTLFGFVEKPYNREFYCIFADEFAYDSDYHDDEYESLVDWLEDESYSTKIAVAPYIDSYANCYAVVSQNVITLPNGYRGMLLTPADPRYTRASFLMSVHHQTGVLHESDSDGDMQECQLAYYDTESGMWDTYSYD